MEVAWVSSEAAQKQHLATLYYLEQIRTTTGSS